MMMPKEGVGIWVDSFVIPKDAKHVANAHAYINDFLDPEVAAKTAILLLMRHPANRLRS